MSIMCLQVHWSFLLQCLIGCEFYSASSFLFRILYVRSETLFGFRPKLLIVLTLSCFLEHMGCVYNSCLNVLAANSVTCGISETILINFLPGYRLYFPKI